jgi:hypothetical protein
LEPNPKRATRSLMADTKANGGVDIMIAALVLIVIFAALAPVVADLVGDGGNLTGGALALYLLTPLLFVIVGVLVILRLVKPG